MVFLNPVIMIWSLVLSHKLVSEADGWFLNRLLI